MRRRARGGRGVEQHLSRLLARTLKSPLSSAGAEDDSLNEMLEQLIEPNPVLVPLSLLQKSVKFVLKAV